MDDAPRSSAARALWQYVRDNEAVIASRAFVAGGEAFTRCDALVRGVHPEIDWEVGPLDGGTYFALGSNGSRALLDVCAAACRQGPELAAIRKLAGRPPKQWSRRILVLVVDGERVEVDFDGWRFLHDPRYGARAILCFPGPLDPRAAREWAMLCRFIVQAELGEAIVVAAEIDFVFVEAGAANAPPEAAAAEGLRDIVERIRRAASV